MRLRDTIAGRREGPVGLEGSTLESPIPASLLDDAGHKLLHWAGQQARSGFCERFLVWAMGPDQVGWIKSIVDLLVDSDYRLQAALHGVLAGQSSLMLALTAPSGSTLDDIKGRLVVTDGSVELGEQQSIASRIEMDAWDLNAPQSDILNEVGHERWSLYCAVPEGPGLIHLIAQMLATYDCWIAGYASNIGASPDASVLPQHTTLPEYDDYCVMHFNVMVPVRDVDFLADLRADLDRLKSELHARKWTFTPGFRRDLSLTMVPAEREGAVTLVVQGVGRVGLVARITGALPSDVSVVASVMAVLEGHTSMSCVLGRLNGTSGDASTNAFVRDVEDAIAEVEGEYDLRTSVKPVVPSGPGRDSEALFWHLSVHYDDESLKILQRTAHIFETLGINIVRMQVRSHWSGVRIIDMVCSVSSDEVATKAEERLIRLSQEEEVQATEWYPESQTRES